MNRQLPYTVEDRGHSTPCHIYAGAIDPVSGYGRTSGGNDAHRRNYEACCGPVASGLVLDHLCRQRACINPEHLEQVTSSVNALRGLTGRQPKKATRKLTAEAVLAIRSSRESNRALARRFGVSHETIRMARTGRYYAEVAA